MRKLLLSAVLFGSALSAHAQTLNSTIISASDAAQSTAAPAGPSWARVQALTANTSLHIRARTRNASCRLKSADADTLTCVSGDGAKTEVYQRSDIKSIKVPHRGRSTVVGLAVGAGAGILTGVALGSRDSLFTKRDLASGFGFAFGGLGAIIGALTDFTRTTVYHE